MLEGMIVECPACRAHYDVGARPVGTRVHCRCGSSFPIRAESRSAGTLKCPQCGAAQNPENATCSFCSASLAVVSCPRCLGRVFQNATFCPHCGAPAAAAAELIPDGRTAPERACPHCQTHASLRTKVLGDVVLDECPRCGGT